MREIDGYYPEDSRVSNEALCDFLRTPLSGDLLEVPGVGPATANLLRNEGISTSFALIGKYLMMKQEGVGTMENADRFYFWLKSIGTDKRYTATIVHCIAEKINLTFVGIYDPNSFTPNSSIANPLPIY